MVVIELSPVRQLEESSGCEVVITIDGKDRKCGKNAVNRYRGVWWVCDDCLKEARESERKDFPLRAFRRIKD